MKSSAQDSENSKYDLVTKIKNSAWLRSFVPYWAREASFVVMFSMIVSHMLGIDFNLIMKHIMGFYGITFPVAAFLVVRHHFNRLGTQVARD
jgi:hypothetical protein